MKYIRTKDGRIIAEEQIDLAIKISNIVNIFDETEILKQADTIEELCDEFVVIRKSDKAKLHLCHWNWKDVVERYWKNDTAIDLFGAIWTDKGLQFVARMNEKGELELL